MTGVQTCALPIYGGRERRERRGRIKEKPAAPTPISDTVAHAGRLKPDVCGRGGGERGGEREKERKEKEEDDGDSLEGYETDGKTDGGLLDQCQMEARMKV